MFIPRPIKANINQVSSCSIFFSKTGQSSVLWDQLGNLPLYKKAFMTKQSSSAAILTESSRDQAGTLDGPNSLQGCSTFKEVLHIFTRVGADRIQFDHQTPAYGFSWLVLYVFCLPPE